MSNDGKSCLSASSKFNDTELKLGKKPEIYFEHISK
jgi:hypothetical protein